MDLPYPSYRKSENGEQSVLNSMNKKLRSTIWSMNDLGKHEQNLPQSTRNDLVKIIQKDDVNKLIKQITKTSILFSIQPLIMKLKLGLRDPSGHFFTFVRDGMQHLALK